jgi:hypothetical protein
MRTRVLLFAIFTGTVRFVTDVAAAEAEEPNDPTSSHTLSVPVGAGVGAMKMPGLYSVALFLQAAPQYRISRAVSVGVVLSYGKVPENGVVMWRASAEGRYHPVRTRVIDLWGGGELGFLSAKTTPAGCPDCGPPPAEVTRARVAPVLGAAIGVDLFPIPYVSLGLEGRGALAIFGADVDREVPTGPTPIVMIGLNLGVHVPIGGSAAE